jgi:D-alanyl-D-alanine carboxypeptidase/D-alanyl-D-alanine-endopeptidase (penicillin-binding protein 4)
MKVSFYLLLIIVIFFKPSTGQESTINSNIDSIYYLNYDPVRDLGNDIENFINIPELFNANIGISVYSITKNQYLYNYNQNKNFTPASLVKLFTSYAGIYFLDQNIKPITELYSNGIVNKKGVLLGDLIIRSNGNPFITNNNYVNIFEDWLSSLDSAGINSISGNLVLDLSYFDNILYPPGWAIDDIKFNYSSQIDALNFNNNLIDIEISSDNNIGEIANIMLKPNTNYIQIDNNIKVVGDNSETDIYYERNFTNNVIYLGGTIKQSEYKSKNYKLKVTVHNPHSYFASIFKDFLISNKISVLGKVIEHNYGENILDYSQMNLMALYEKESIYDMIKEINAVSENLYAEILLKMIAKEKTGIGSTEKGIDQLKKLSEEIGIPGSGFKLYDGSGLSRMNLLSPVAIIRLLNYIAAQKEFNQYLQTLAKPNERGTLKNRLKGTNAEKRIWAKTGSMNFVNNIAGYVKTIDGELISFTICFNNFTTPASTIRNIQDLIVLRLSGFNRNINKDK